MKPAEVIRAVLYPLTEPGVLIPMLVFWLLMILAGNAGLLGLWLAVVIVPAVFRYQVLLLEARSRGRTPEPPGIEFFSLAGNLWSLFPAVIAVAAVLAGYEIYRVAGVLPTLVFVGFAASVYPAMLGVLAITHAPLQSVNPAAVARFIRRCGPDYWYAPTFLCFAAFVSLHGGAFGDLFAGFVEMFLLFSLHSLIGTVIQPVGMIEDVDIPAPVARAAVDVKRDLDKARTRILNHAYGFISRDNRDGGFEHIFRWMDTEDPDPVGAWAWFFEQMLGWESPRPALFFAQHYLHDLLEHGEQLPAAKLMMRCRLIDDTFRPLREDLDAAIAAADAVANAKLGDALRRI